MISGPLDILVGNSHFSIFNKIKYLLLALQTYNFLKSQAQFCKKDKIKTLLGPQKRFLKFCT